MTYAHPDFLRPWDHHEYIQMASASPLDFHTPPYCWRIVNPLIARALPFGLQWNFLIISLLSLGMTGVTVYYLAKISGFSNPQPFIGMVMFFSLGWATKFVLYDFWLPDPLSFLVITLAIYCILAKKDIYFATLLATGVAVKESVVFVAPLYYTLNARQVIDIRLARRALLLVLPALTVLVGLRFTIPQTTDGLISSGTLSQTIGSAKSGESSDGYWGKVKENIFRRLRTLSRDAFYHGSVGTFGVMLTLLPFFSLKRNFALLVRFLPFLVLVCSQVFFVRNTERLLVAGFPAVILLALNGVDAIGKGLGARPVYLIGLPLLFFGLNLIKPGNFSAPFEIQALVFILFLAFAFLTRQKHKDNI